MLIQIVGVLVTVAWSGVCTAVILKLVGFVTALRVTPEAEQMGLDITQHGEFDPLLSACRVCPYVRHSDV